MKIRDLTDKDSVVYIQNGVVYFLQLNGEVELGGVNKLTLEGFKPAESKVYMGCKDMGYTYVAPGTQKTKLLHLDLDLPVCTDRWFATLPYRSNADDIIFPRALCKKSAVKLYGNKPSKLSFALNSTFRKDCNIDIEIELSTTPDSTYMLALLAASTLYCRHYKISDYWRWDTIADLHSSCTSFYYNNNKLESPIVDIHAVVDSVSWWLEIEPKYKSLIINTVNRIILEEKAVLNVASDTRPSNYLWEEIDRAFTGVRINNGL